MDQTQTVLSEPLGELREAVRNVMKPRDKNTFSIISDTARPAPHRAVKQARKVQDQWESKCYFSLPLCWPSPRAPLQYPFTAVPRGSLSPPLL